MTKTMIERLENAWCDEGHKIDELVFKIDVDGKDFQLCSKHLASILSEKLGDAPKFRNLPVVDYTYVHNDRGEFYEETISIPGVKIRRDACHPKLSLKVYPDLQKIIDSVKDHENVCFVETDEMEGKYDTMGETKKFLVSSKKAIDAIVNGTDIRCLFDPCWGEYVNNEDDD